MGATKASATAFLIPVVALILGVVIRDEHVAPLSLVGAAVCLAGAWSIRRARPSSALRRPRPRPPASSRPAADAAPRLRSP